MKKTIKEIVPIFFLAIAITLGIIMFFMAANRKTEIYAISYDEQVKFSVGRFKVDGFYISPRYGNSYTKAENAQSFLEEIVKENPYLYDSFEVQDGKYSYINYVFLYEGYYFWVWLDASGTLAIENAAGEFLTSIDEFFFAFPQTDIAPIEDEENYYTWQELGIADFEELCAFYSNVKSEYYMIDTSSNTIKLSCCDATNFLGITTNYPITIQADANGIAFFIDIEEMCYD